MQLIIFFQRSEYNGVRDGYCKNIKILFYHNISCLFSYPWWSGLFMISIQINVGNDMYSGGGCIGLQHRKVV